MNSRPGSSAWDTLDDIQAKLAQLGPASPGPSSPSGSPRPRARFNTRCSVWDQKMTKSMHLRVSMSNAARRMGVFHLLDRDSAATV